MNQLKNIAYLAFVIFTFQVSTNAQICVGTPGEVTWSYWQNLGDDELEELYALDAYPNNPDGTQVINSLQSPVNFDNFYGSRIRGFISVPSTESIQFNITGDDEAQFYLSSDENPQNIQLEAFLPNYSQREQHDKYPEQTSRSISLIAGQYYYFELHQVEGGGGDHVSLWWKTSFTGLVNWSFVSSLYIADVGCEETECPERGTPCNDLDPNTTDDRQDGHCNCAGIPISNNGCIGQRDALGAYYYYGIPGSDLNDLYMNANYPAVPNNYESLDMFGINSTNPIDSLGTLIQSFLSVPVTGYYSFNLTANDDAIFFLSSNEDPAFKQTTQILTTSATGTVEHDKFVYQTSAPIYLEAGKYYYVELNHKESSYSQHYSVFWKTPFTDPSNWKRIPSFYFHDYNCEIACVPKGTPCNDGDPFTNNDQYDNNCNCVGTPCSGPDCNDPLASYIPYPECGLTDQLDNRADASWLSCLASQGPNPARGSAHWIQYDLGSDHRIWNSHVWNYNVSGNTDQGFQSVNIDYSYDGVTWTALDTYNWPLASGSSEYAGFVGPDFGGIQARYILLTSNDAGACRGISKMAFTTRQCGPEGSSCDDGDPATAGDKFDNDCNCAGVIGSENECVNDTLMLGDSVLTMSLYSAITFLQSSSELDAHSDAKFMAKNEVNLMPGFESAAGGILEVLMEDCQAPHSIQSQEIISALKNRVENQPLVITKLEKAQEYIIQYYVSQPGDVKLELRDINGKVIVKLLDHSVRNAGYYVKRLPTKKLNNSNYQVALITQSNKVVKKMSVL